MDQKRRKLLGGFLGASLLAAPVAGVIASQERPVTNRSSSKNGYRATPHVDAYYKSLRF